ncbi:hypothetical protein LCGC14_0323160 [marine sediment metagenome]|uniref:Uncharacterized protein n=1 Tax=marine sediment metagenome TaxID=412755 RepID=A0A0F9U1B4_9ZZZZ
MNAADRMKALGASLEAMLEAATDHVLNERKMSANDLLELSKRLRTESVQYARDSEEQLVLMLAAAGSSVLLMRIFAASEQENKGGPTQ